MITKFFNNYWESTIINGRSFLTTNVDFKIEKIISLINFFYFLVLIVSIQPFSPFSQLPEWSVLLNSEMLFEPVWSLSWATNFSWNIIVNSILLLFFSCSLLALIFWKRSRVIRVLVFLSIFFHLSLISSFGKIDHWMHLMMISTFLLIFLPDFKKKKSKNIELLQVFFGIQSFLLFTYFLSSLHKVLGVIRQEYAGNASALSSSSLAEFAGLNSYQHANEYFFTSFALHNSSYITSAFLVMGLCTEFCSVFVIFRPKYHRIWGIILILLHSFILMLIGPDFTIQILVIGVFILFSPFSDNADITDDITSIFEDIWSKLFKSKSGESIVIYYDGDCVTCNKFLSYISKYKIPEVIKISSQSSKSYVLLISNYPDLKKIDSIVILEHFSSGSPRIRIKADAITWLLTKIEPKFKIIRGLYLACFLLGDLVYDIVAISRKKSSENCLLPPENLRKIVLKD